MTYRRTAVSGLRTAARTVLAALLLAPVLLAAAGLAAQSLAPVVVEAVTVCEAHAGETAMPDFADPACRAASLYDVSPFQRLLWLRAEVMVSPALLASAGPLGVFISGKASSVVYVNGRLVGRNGVPALTAAAEVPGKMDAVLYLPRSYVTTGANELVIQMSGQNGYIKLAGPLHGVAIAPYATPLDAMLRYHLPSFFPLGVLVAGAIYFGVLALYHGGDKRRLLVPLAAFFAAAQLVMEGLRGVITYLYPFHDIRLVLILLCAVGCGVCLLLHVIDRFVAQYRARLTVVALTLVAVLIVYEKGFDGKSFLALLVPALIGGLIAAAAAWRRQPGALAYAAVLLGFSLAMGWSPHQVFDVYFYYLVAALLLFLFTQQIQLLIREKRLRAVEQARAGRLQLILDESREQHSPTPIKVVQTGKVDVIPSDHIAFCKGARDYVEIKMVGNGMAGGGSVLHNGSLAELERELPSAFLRVHRSYLVNTRLIQSLTRESSGSGSLLLTTGDTVPVSRRIMPKVRQALR